VEGVGAETSREGEALGFGSSGNRNCAATLVASTSAKRMEPVDLRRSMVGKVSDNE